MEYAIHWNVKCPSEVLRGRVQPAVGPISFEFANHSFTANWKNQNLLLFSGRGTTSEVSPPLGLAGQALEGLFLLAIELLVKLEYLNHEIDGQAKLESGRCSSTYLGPPLPILDLNEDLQKYELALKGISLDSHLRAAFGHYKLAVRLEDLDNSWIGTRPALVEYGIAIEAIGYRLGGHDSLGTSLEEIATAFPAIPPITDAELTAIRNARNHGGHYWLFHASRSQIPREADHFCRIAGAIPAG